MEPRKGRPFKIVEQYSSQIQSPDRDWRELGRQQRRIRVLMAIAADDPLRPSYVGALLDGLRSFGWENGK
jgi:hypothetical protein